MNKTKRFPNAAIDIFDIWRLFRTRIYTVMQLLVVPIWLILLEYSGTESSITKVFFVFYFFLHSFNEMISDYRLIFAFRRKPDLSSANFNGFRDFQEEKCDFFESSTAIMLF